MTSPIVFFDIAGPGDTRLAAFYSAVFGWEADGDGRFTVDVSSPLEAAVREDPAEKRLYVGVPDVTEALDRVETNGGSIETERFEVPGVVILGLFRDPAGNPMGLVEMDGDEPRIP